MFSSIFGKRRSSPVEDETPPIPGPKPDDGFVIVDPNSPRVSGGGIYPNISGVRPPYNIRPAPPPPLPKTNSIDQTFNYLQGVPFSLCRELKMASNTSFTSELSDLLALIMNKGNHKNYDYNFSVEKSVLKEFE